MKENIGKAGFVLGRIGLGILLVGKLYEDIRRITMNLWISTMI